MSSSRTQTTTTRTTSTTGPSRSRPIPPSPPVDSSVHEEEGLEDKDDGNIIRRMQEQVERQQLERRQRKRRENGPFGHDNERRRLMAAAATARSQREISLSEASASPRRPIVEIWKTKKGKKNTKAQPVGADPDDSDDSDDDDDDEENQAPCKQFRNKKLHCQMQAGKRSSIICKPCLDAKVKCLYWGRPTASKQQEGGSGERIAVMKSQMVQGLANLRALRETHFHSQQYLDQLLRTQEDDYARLIAIETRMAMMGIAEGPAMTGLLWRITERQQLLK
ncbi:hypothetical protein F5879DRAFT_995903 [Lentinula edodes]|nr:hypothetical protein F5879DRAFT_995903 [Lentinula edodes]